MWVRYSIERAEKSISLGIPLGIHLMVAWPYLIKLYKQTDRRWIGLSPHSFEFFTISISVRLSDRSKVTQYKINFVNNCPQWGSNPQSLDNHSNSLPTMLGKNLLGRRFLKWALFVSCTTSHVGLCSFLESIEHERPLRFRLATECWLSSVGRALESWSGVCEFKLHWGQFLKKFILFCVTLDLSDNLTETRFVKNSICYIPTAPCCRFTPTSALPGHRWVWTSLFMNDSS